MSPPNLLIPESPIIHSAILSPDLRVTEASTSKHRRIPSSSRYRSPPFLANPSPSALSSLLNEAEQTSRNGKGNDLRSSLILRSALRWAVSHGDIELISWLAGLGDRWAEILDAEVQMMEDDDGWGLVGMAIQSSCGRQEMEEGVRIIVGRWGLDVGPRRECNSAGWTSLHLAVLISTPPLISFLLTRGALASAVNKRGLTPLDLVANMPDREDIAYLLDHAASTAPSPIVMNGGEGSRDNMLRRRRMRMAGRSLFVEDRERRRKMALDREAWLRQKTGMMDVDIALLLPPVRRGGHRRSIDSGLAWMDDEGSPSEEEEEDEDGDNDDEGIGDIPTDPGDANMLVFSPAHLSSIFDILISSYRPDCLPVTSRSLPANAIFLYARFAHHRCDESWLEELLEGGVERIEEGVYSHVEDLAYLAFWAYNTTLLLHLLRSDEGLNAACEELKLTGMVEELVNAIHVFVIRVAERRIDGILDTALLDHETLADFDDVRFEGEWTLFRTFGTKKQRQSILPKASAIFANGSPGGPVADFVATSPMFNSVREASSPFKTPSRMSSIQDLKSGISSSMSMDSISSSTVNGQSLAGEEAVTPARVVDYLTGVLTILRLYEVNPAIIVQAFSQIFFWISCELFNRILTRKKYLCRSRAVQIRMNITVLDDWVRANGLPVKTATKHLEPVLQLLQWLQCSSQIRDFDTLIGTLQTLKALNPMQMRRAVRDYRFEVNEGKMTDECAQYLAQLQKDWERRRVQTSVKEAQKQRERSESGEMGEATMEYTPIDALFEGDISLLEFVPQSAPECLGELLDSRFMLPFHLPVDNEYLIATPPSDVVFNGFIPPSPFMSGSRPPSRSSFSSSRPMGYSIPDPRKIRRLPTDFFSWLKEKESERRHNRDRQPRPKIDRQATLQPPFGAVMNESEKSSARPAIAIKPPSTIMAEDEITPLATAHPFSSHGSLVTSSFSNSRLSTSSSLEHLREQSKIPFEPVPLPSHKRSDSYELKIRPMSAGTFQFPVSTSSPQSGDEPGGKKWWNLNRMKSGDDLRKAREGSEGTIRMEGVVSPGSAGSSGSKFWGR